MYGSQFSKVYNEFGWNYFPEAFGQQLLEWMQNQDFHPESVMDIGCGTGILCNILNSNGIQTLGTDLSENMISIAREQFPGLRFKVANMITFIPDENFDLITCTGDALNHVLAEDDVLQVFRNAFAALNPGGYFIFDILSGKEIGDGTPIDLEYDDTTSAQFLITQKEQSIVQLHIAVHEKGNSHFEETVTERLYAPEIIHALLEHAGFAEIQMRDHLLNNSDNHSTTYYFICRKPAPLYNRS